MATKGKRILVVEDEMALAKAMKLKLESAGFEVKNAYNGVEAIEILEKEAYDLILLDLVMPKLDGFGVLSKLKTLGIKTRVMVLTNLSQANDAEKAKSLGATHFFIKAGVQIAALVNYIKKITAHS